MKNKLLLCLSLLLTIAFTSQAQHIRTRLRFPVGVGIRATVPAPFSGAIWIGPEWEWRGGQYIQVPGYWAKPPHRNARWRAGKWSRSRQGFIWIAGGWR